MPRVTAGAALLLLRGRSCSGLRSRCRATTSTHTCSTSRPTRSLFSTTSRRGAAFSSSSSAREDDDVDAKGNINEEQQRAALGSPRRVWRSASSSEGRTAAPTAWSCPVDDHSKGDLRAVLDRIGEQETESGRMKQNHQGVFRADPSEDMR
jgi:hypothetical protein